MVWGRVWVSAWFGFLEGGLDLDSGTPGVLLLLS